MTNKVTKYGLMTIAAVLLVALAFAGSASAGSVYEIDSPADFYQFVTDVNASTVVDATYSAQLTDDITLDNKTVFNPAVTTNVILDLNGHVITSRYTNSSSFLLKDNTVLDIYDNSSSSDVHTYTSVTVTDAKNTTGLSTRGGSILGGGIIWRPLETVVDYQSAGNPKSYGDVSGYDNRAPVGTCFQVNNSNVLKIHGGTLANFIGTNGGSIAIIKGGECFIDGGLITDCGATNQGGGICAWGNATIYGGEISDCYGRLAGGVYSGSTFVMSGGSITGCVANTAGGVYNVGTFVLSGGVINRCTVTGSGGGVYSSGSTAQFNMSSGEINGCTSPGYGGGVVVISGSQFNMSGGVIANCEGAYGGAIYDQGVVRISGSALIENCTATSDEDGGGAVKIMQQRKLYVDGGTFRNNKAVGYGGAILVGNGMAYVSGGVFENNVAKYGGAIVFGGCHENSPYECALTGGIFRGNKDDDGPNAIVTMRGAYIDPQLIVGGNVVLEDDQTFKVNAINADSVFKIGTPVDTCVLPVEFTSEPFIGSIKNFVIDNDGLDGRTLFVIKSGQNATDVIGRLGMKDSTKWTLVADDTSDPKKITIQLNKPVASSVYYNWSNDGTSVNVSVALTEANTADKASVLFYNATDRAYFIVTNTADSGSKPATERDWVEWKWTNDPTGATMNGATAGTLGAGASGKYYMNINEGKAYFLVRDSTGVLMYLSNPTEEQKKAAFVNPVEGDYIDLIGYVVTFTPLNTTVGMLDGDFEKSSIIEDISVENLVSENEYTVKVVLENSDLSVKNFGFDFGTVTYDTGLPVITAHPQGATYKRNALVNNLQVDSYAVGGLKYQWENSTDGETYDVMERETYDNITPSNATVGTTYYRVNVTADGKSVYSLAAAVEVYDTYKINYNPQGGVNPDENPRSYSSNESVALEDPVLQYYIGYWENETTKSPVSVIYKGTTGDISLIANYTPKEYYIAYIDGGTTTNPASYNVKSGTIYLTDATKDGYKFIGWYDNAAFTGDKVISISSDTPKDTTLYARWVEQVTKTVDSEGNATFNGDERIATARIAGAQALLSEISGLTPSETITFVKDIPGVSASDLPAKSGYYTNLYSAFEINYDGTLSGDAQITLKVTLANGDSADSLRALHQSSSGWEDLEDVAMTQSGNVVTIVGNVSSFSPFAVVSYSAVPQQYVPSSSKQTGSTIILQEGQVAPTPYPTVAPTGDSIEETDDLAEQAEQPATPTVIATAKPTTQPTQSSPAPFVGLLAGLGVVALVLNRMRK